MGCELLSNFLYFCSRNNSENDFKVWYELWIALKFFVLLQSKQPLAHASGSSTCCELLSNFLYFCSRNNRRSSNWEITPVVNCSQIFCTFAVETTAQLVWSLMELLWIALKFFVLLQSKQQKHFSLYSSHGCELLSNFLYFCSRNNSQALVNWRISVVNCSQIFCTFAVETTLRIKFLVTFTLWIALKFFVLLQSKQRDYRTWLL